MPQETVEDKINDNTMSDSETEKQKILRLKREEQELKTQTAALNFSQKLLKIAEKNKKEANIDPDEEILKMNNVEPESEKDIKEKSEIKQEAQKIISDGKAMDYILDYLEPLYLGEVPQKKLSILATGTLGVKNVNEPFHRHNHGKPEVGKSALNDQIMTVIPRHLKIQINSFSSKALLYKQIKEGNKIICSNDTIFNDELIKFVNDAMDIIAWEKGYTYSVVINQVSVDLSLPPRLQYIFGSNKTIPEYRTDKSTADYDAAESRMYSYEVKKTDEEILTLQKHLYMKEKNIPIDNERKGKVVTEIFNILLTTPKHIEPLDIDFDTYIKPLLPKGKLRAPQRIYTLFKCSALFRNSNKVEKIDIDTITKLLNEVVSEEKAFERDIPIILKEIMPEEIFKIYDLSNEKVALMLKELFSNKGIASRCGINMTTLGKRLTKLRKEGLVDFTQTPRDRQAYIYYKKLDKTPFVHPDLRQCGKCHKPIEKGNQGNLCSKCEIESELKNTNINTGGI